VPTAAHTRAPDRLDEDTLEAVADTLRAFADPTRIRLISALDALGPATASGLAAALPLTRQAVSRQLCVLHSAGILRRRREGTGVVYELRDFTGPWLVSQLVDTLRSGS
jgi:DNA-binding transcriptional ArsR family regulator